MKISNGEDCNWMCKQTSFIRVGEISNQLTIPKCPVIIKTMANTMIDGRKNLHVALPPDLAQVSGLKFEQLNSTKAGHQVAAPGTAVWKEDDPNTQTCKSQYDSHDYPKGLVN